MYFTIDSTNLHVMKYLNLLLFVLSSSLAYSQTNSLEDNSLYNGPGQTEFQRQMDIMNDAQPNSFSDLYVKPGNVYHDGVVIKGNKYYMLIEQNSKVKTEEMPQFSVDPMWKATIPNPLLDEGVTLAPVK